MDKPISPRNFYHVKYQMEVGSPPTDERFVLCKELEEIRKQHSNDYEKIVLKNFTSDWFK